MAALKKHRLREFGLWHVDPPEYYGRVPPGLEGPAAGRLASTGDFPLKALAYGGEGEVLAFVEGQERARYGPSGTGHGMPLMEKHWLGMSYQLAAFRRGRRCAGLAGLAPCPLGWRPRPPRLAGCRRISASRAASLLLSPASVLATSCLRAFCLRACHRHLPAAAAATTATTPRCLAAGTRWPRRAC